MAFNAAVVLEVRLTGSDTNGGGFQTGASGTDWSLQDAAQYSVTDGVTAGTTTITSATANFGTDVVGNIMYVQGGTGSVVAGWYQITSRTNNTTIVVDRSTGLTAGTGVTLKIGGALQSPGMAGGVLVSGGSVAGNKVFIKYNASPYVITTNGTNVSGGCAVPPSDVYWSGYDTTRALYTIQAHRPTLQLNSGVSSANVMGGTNNTYYLQSLILDANSQTSSRGAFQTGEFFYVKAMNATTAGIFNNGDSGKAFLCEATGCTATPIRVAFCHSCVAYNNTLTSPTNAGAFQQNGLYSSVNCIAYGNNCIGFTTFLNINCTSYGNSLAGFDAINQTTICANCIAENNATTGYRTNVGRITLINCASYNNTSGRYGSGGGTLNGDVNPITGSGSFFTNAASQDFSLNNTAGAGASARAVGFPASFPVGTNLNYHDVGALQHQDSGGGGSTGISRARGASGF